MDDLEDMRERYAARPQTYASPYIKALEARVTELVRRSDGWQEVARNENEQRKAAQARVTKLEATLTDAMTRMERARSILNNTSSDSRGNWGMLDTADLRATLIAAEEPNHE